MPVSGSWTPKASRGTRLLLAAAVWTAVGVALTVAGIAWITGSGSARALPAGVAAAAIGLAKGRWLLAPRARANVDRIAATAESRCFGGFLSARAWLLVVGMMVLGAVLRRSPLSEIWLGSLYAAVGTALVAGSYAAWSGWARFRRPGAMP